MRPDGLASGGTSQRSFEPDSWERSSRMKKRSFTNKRHLARRNRTPPIDYPLVMALYQWGIPLRDIAASCRCSETSIHEFVRAWNLMRHPRGGYCNPGGAGKGGWKRAGLRRRSARGGHLLPGGSPQIDRGEDGSALRGADRSVLQRPSP